MRAVEACPDFKRIDALPRRAWTDEQIAQLVTYYTEKLRAPYGTETLRPVQAVAIHEAALAGGLFGPIGCGEGKTLPSLLIPTVLGAKRPILIVPANLREKTLREMPEISANWKLHPSLSVLSYSELAIESRADELEKREPDLIVTDESHKLKSGKASITKRIYRYMRAHPDCKFIALSGTILTNNLEDLAHISAWALRQGSPYPFDAKRVKDWAAALNGDVLTPIDPGPIVSWPVEPTTEPVLTRVEYARRAVRKRASDTLGVVASSKGEQFEGSILLSKVKVPQPEHVQAHFQRLRQKWEMPDGWALALPVELWCKAREFALGFHYAWDPRPPLDWYEARAQYAGAVRRMLESSYTTEALRVDSEKQLRTLIESGDRRVAGVAEHYARWRRVEPSFQVNRVIVWHDTGAMDKCIAWAKKSPGIVWTSHADFARALSKRSGMEYYGQDACNAAGRHVMDHSPKESFIASVEACGTGQNLQAWHRNLWTAPRGKSPEQLIARTHRPGQKHDEVIFDVLEGCREHDIAIPRAIEHAQMLVATVPGATQKILRASVDWPELNAREWGLWQYQENMSRPPSKDDVERYLDEADAADDAPGD